MIRLGLRLTLSGGREAAVRLVVTILAVALGVGLLLVALAGMHGISAQNARSAWLNTNDFGFRPGPGLPDVNLGPQPPSNADPLWWLADVDHFGTHSINRIDVAATGPTSPVPPGIAHLPGPGQFYASPALTRLLKSTPAGELGDRYLGTQIGTIGPAASPAPNSLIIVIGHDPAQLSTVPGTAHVTSINSDTAHAGANGWDSNKLQVVLAVGVLALLFPILIFIGTATRLSGVAP